MRSIEAVKMPFLVAVLYFIGAETAFLIGTLSDKIFAPFWPPNIVLFCALLLVPTRQWWIYILATLPAHVVAELGVGMAAPAVATAFVTNCLVAIFNALAVRRFLRGPPWFGTLRQAVLYILITAVASPAVVALGGAFVPILGGEPLENYGHSWAQWYASNALGGLTLGPVALSWFCEHGELSSLPPRRKLEALLSGIALVVACSVAFDLAATMVASGFLPVLLYGPLPLILWLTVRFGARGAGGAMLLVTVTLIWRTLNAPSLFITADAETNVLALQIFILGLAVPMLLLGASIDEARHAAEITRESEQRMIFTANKANIGFWQLDRATAKLWLSDNCHALLGLPPGGAELTQPAILSVIHPEDRPTVVESIRGAAYAGELALNEFRVVRPDGTIRWFLARSYAERNARGTPVRIAGYISDITPRKTAEAEAEQQRREVAHLMRVSVLGELSGAIAHELNQPLTAILSNAQAAQHLLAQNTPNFDELRATLADIVKEDTRASEVVHRLRGLLKNSENKTESVNLNKLVHSTLRLLRGELTNRKVKVDLALAKDLPTTSGDPVQLQQLLLNVLMNAMEAMGSVKPTRRLIAISTHAAATGIELVVADRGRGIAAHEKSLLLQPFFSTKERGLGLGLSICSTIVASHGGEFSLTSNADGGATVIIRLPADATRFMVAAK
jgi:PAS domain S-box-containing protein